MPIGTLAVIVVGLTIAAVAALAHALIPAIPWPAAVALGAIVAPPDASAATAVLRQLSLPHRLLVILEGESLLNDAMALLIYRVAVAMAMGASPPDWTLPPELVLTTVGGGVLGWVLARIGLFLRTERAEIAVSILAQFIGTFAVWIIADRIGVSAIITVVVYAMTIARYAPLRLSARHRIASYVVWDVVVFVLNVLAFVLIGLQINAIIGRLDENWIANVGTASAVFATVVALLRREYAARASGDPEAPDRSDALAALQRQAVAAQRRALIDLRRIGTIGADAFQAIEPELDIIELTADPHVRTMEALE